MKWSRAFVGALAAASLALAACGGAETDPEETAAPSPGNGEAPAEATIGIVNLLSHPALDAAQAGFIEALAEAGYVEGENLTLDIQNANNDQSTLTNIANTFASGDADLFYAIATPSAQSLAQVITDRPIVFAAVTDPVSAGLVDEWENPGGNITGVSDMNPMDGQLNLIQEVLPDVQTVGIVYSSGEVNSEVQVEQAQAVADELGIEIRTATVTNSAEVQQAAQSLDVDAFLIPTDNTVVSAAESVIQVAEQKGVPVFASDESTMERGAAAGLSVNYTQQGKDAAALAIQLLEGADPASLPVETQKEFDLFVNEAAAEAQGITLPAEVIERSAKQF
ncbi:ABC transporter substrate-binding protein [Tessaracoccus oleiagri]|uniref:Putative ABC transport system substrate-binding protein n=1 Tax=Tessaracoccus oleiagri TaxID=686624 RepID=A0A1G9KUV2_9ACTN|nr:ABC transporter substrate-binding protein [Tessaracoccus oleiagri]SDL53660.1 putative ABC transport system substrate-binding protein [Tessaracoccus oleiagri]